MVFEHILCKMKVERMRWLAVKKYALFLVLVLITMILISYGNIIL